MMEDEPLTTLERVQDMIGAILDVDRKRVTKDADLFDDLEAGMSDYLLLACVLEEEFGVFPPPLDELGRLRTPQEFVLLIERLKCARV